MSAILVGRRKRWKPTLIWSISLLPTLVDLTKSLDFPDRLSVVKFLFNKFFINSSENLSQHPHAHEVSRYRAVSGKKKEKNGVGNHHKECFIIQREDVLKELDQFTEERSKV